MFRMIGIVVTRTWPLWLLAWAAVFAAGWRLAPDWDEVADDGVFQFLPDELPSRRAEDLMRLAFPDGQSDSAIVILARRPDRPLGPEDEAFLRDRLVPGLEQIAADLGPGPRPDPLVDDGRHAGEPDADADAMPEEPETDADAEPDAGEDAAPGEARGPRALPDATPGPGEGERPEVIRIRSLANDVERPVLVSEDGRATIVQIELGSSFMDRSNRLVVEPARALVDRLRRGGDAPRGLELAVTGSAVVGHDINAREDVSARVIERWTIWWVLLLLLAVHRAPLLALVQVVTVFVAMQVTLSLLALMARAGWIELFESLDVYTTVLVYGAGIDYSLFLISRYRERLGEGVPPREAMVEAIGRVGLAVTISAGTAIVAIGTLLFADFGMFSRAGFTIPFGLFVMLLASLTVTPALLLILGHIAAWPSRAGRVDPLAGIWRRLGGGLTRRPGLIWAASLAAMLPFAAFGARHRDELSYAPMSEIPGDAASVSAVGLLEEHFPAGLAGPLTVVLRAEGVDFSSDEGIALVDRLSDGILARKDELGLAGLRSVADGFGESLTPEQQEAERRERQREPGLGRAIGNLMVGATDALVPGAPSEQAMAALRERAVSEYVGGPDGHRDATRLVVVPSYDPFGDSALDGVSRLREAVVEALPEGLSGAEVAVAGPSASLRDLRDVSRVDRRRIYLYATAGVTLVLVVLLRRLAVSLYLVGTVLLGYLVTLGVTILVFRAIEGPGYDGIDWTVPVFLFTLLMAVGADYNVFLVARVDEEQERLGPVPGVLAGLSKTGGIISGCGVIMAGTFAALIWGGTLSSLDQLGFALVFGVLLDTFFIRPLLVPSYLILIHGGRLGRLGRLLGGRPDHRPAVEQPAGAAAE
ncbi:MMPL family transporter [Tautonia plasticadhaerens]|uniref:Membrane transport protein mmpL8 n=1 Tax=Tautonia plasticadhaerens TaxID=2527974 RepID=A0A518H0Z2_9BACT|nr:MMPL family transporter [Tautonia plasticadhaerens]QDV34514.1 Membrane transport protein mmpL8 [Tautonia plasticadhaerens]